ncbi:hypothetical protein [Hymenobacter sp. B81]|uniref:hypothetical protein n=1 Tax=Hymenobacter sp. B81 TaxID=3344878 RepID=UPI0037DD3859
MLLFRRVLTVVVMLYLLVALLFIATPASRESMMSVLGSPPADFWYTMTFIGAVLLLLELLVENVHGVGLRRDITRHEAKINELKARLYDHHLDRNDAPLTTPAAAAPAYHPPAPAPGAIPRTGTAVPPPSAADLPPTTHPNPTYPSGAPNQPLA